MRSIARTVYLRDKGLPGSPAPETPYANERVVDLLISCLDNEDWNVRGEALRWLTNVGANDPAKIDHVIAALATQLTKEQASQENQEVKGRVKKARRLQVIQGVIEALKSPPVQWNYPGGPPMPGMFQPATQAEGKNRENEIASRAAVRMFEERDLRRIQRSRPQTLKNLSPTQGNRVALAAAKSLKIEDYLIAIGIRDIHKDNIYKDIHEHFTKHHSQDSPAEAECRRQLGINVEAADWLGYLARERLIDDPGVLPYLIEATNHPDRVSVASRCLGSLTLLTRRNSGLPSTNPMRALENRKTRNEIVSWWKNWWEKSKDKHPIYDARLEKEVRGEFLRLAKVIESRVKPRYQELSMFTVPDHLLSRWPPRWPPLFHVYYDPARFALSPFGVSRDDLPWFHISCTFKTPDLPSDTEFMRRRSQENLPPKHLRNLVRKVFSRQLEGTDIVIEVFAASKRDQLLHDLATTLDEKSSSQPATQAH